jgi:catechol 2,3-dioxygenase-like lactoylglutathione lyase family enzyme
MSVQHISAITLAVRDMARAVGFYRKIGLEFLYGGEDAAFTSFRVGIGYVNLIFAPAHVPIWWGRVIFRVDQADATYLALLKQGLQPETPRDGPWGERYFHLKDPDGHELSFAELLPR